MKPVCLVIGAGAGIGGNVAMKFAREGYHSVICRRSNQEGLNNIVESIESEGGTATGLLFDAVKDNTIEDTVISVETKIGQINTVVYNLGSQIGDLSLEDTSYKKFELGWRMATFGLFRLATSVCPLMEKRQKGCILVTSSTASVRGNYGQHSHAASMGGRRMLCQSLNAEYAIKGIHVAHIVIDGAVDAPDTLGRMMGAEKFKEFKKKIGDKNDGLILPDKIADTYYHISQQHRSTWSHEIDIRSFSDLPWWNNGDKKYIF